MNTKTAATLPEGYVLACSLDEVPARGKKTVHVGDTTVLIIACGEDLHAVEDRCPQTGGSIAHGEVLNCMIAVPTTGAHYDLRTGRYLGGGQSPLPSQLLTVFPLRVAGGKVYIRLHRAAGH